MLRDSMESVKVLNEENGYRAVKNIALSLWRNMDIYHLGVVEQFKCLTIPNSDIKKPNTNLSLVEVALDSSSC